MPRTNQTTNKTSRTSGKSDKKVDGRKRKDAATSDSAKQKKRQQQPQKQQQQKRQKNAKTTVFDGGVDKTHKRRGSSSKTRNSFEDARKTGMVKLPESTVERFFHKKLVQALSFYTGKTYTRKEVQLQSGVHKLLEALCNIGIGDVLHNSKLFTTARNKLTTKKNDIACGWEVTNRSGAYGNLMLPALVTKSKDEGRIVD